jgi:ABC-type methionine transport system ATPase subunit
MIDDVAESESKPCTIVRKSLSWSIVIAMMTEKLDGGFNAIMTEKGVSLLGGQRQRIAIARAVVKDPVIMITDETTSALDADSEKKVQIALDEVMKNRAAVVVAHRLSTIRNAHAIYVFDGGKIVERGTHNELVQNEEDKYFNLVRRQLMQDTDVKEKSKIRKSCDVNPPNSQLPDSTSQVTVRLSLSDSGERSTSEPSTSDS